VIDLIPSLERPPPSLLDPDAIGVLALDGSDTVHYTNAAGARLLGRTQASLAGMPFAHLVRALDGHHTSIPCITRLVRDGTSWSGVLEAPHPDGDAVRLDATMSVLSSPARPEPIAVVLVDARSSAFGSLGWYALHDPLTGLANRALLVDRLALAIASADRHHHYVATIFIDLDGFKAVNDTLGHEAGDRVLRQMGERLQELLRPTDTLARYGGDELVAVCEAPSVKGLHEIIDRLDRSAVVSVGPGWDVGVSIGAVITTGSGVTEADLLRRADQAMYRAKVSGQAEVDLDLG